jgi:hypothetical protein
MSKKLVSRRLTDTKENSKKDKEEMTQEDLLKQIKDLKEENKTLKQGKEEVVPHEDDRLEADTYVEVQSICPTLLTLSTEPKGRGINYTWNEFGEVRQIVYGDLQKIIQNHGSGLYTDFIRKGYVYINNPAVVKKSGLKEIYKKLLSKEQIDEVLKCHPEVDGVSKSVELFESTIKSQQKLIALMLIDKIARGASLDLNVVDKIKRISDIDIAEKANSTQGFLEYNLKQSTEE